MTDKKSICEVTVTVSGERGSGKTTLMAVLAQALRGAGHEVIVPDHTPTAAKAISDLTRPYVVTFREPASEHPAEARAEEDAKDDKIKRLSETLDKFRDKLITVAKERDEARAKLPDPVKAAELVRKALTFARESAIIERDRQDLNRRTEDLKIESAKMRDEADARMVEAHDLLTEALTGTRPPRKTPAQRQMERRVAARNLTASEKLALANGKTPSSAEEHVIASAIDDNALAIAEAMAQDGQGVGYRPPVPAQTTPLTAREAAWAGPDVAARATGEATLASLIERSLLGEGG